MQKYWWYNSEWHAKMDKSLQVAGMGERTREAYLRSMRQLVEYYDKYPDLISEEELLDYFIHRQNVTGWSPATMRICYSGVKFFFTHILKERLASSRYCPGTSRAAFTGGSLQR